MPTVDLRFARPHELELDTSVATVKLRRGRLRVGTTQTLAEPENAEGGDHGSISWSGGRLAFDRVLQTPDGTIWHEGAWEGDRPTTGDRCFLHIDRVRRLHNATYHSFSHLLTAVHAELARRDLTGRSEVFEDHGELLLRDAVDRRGELAEAWARAQTYLGVDDPVEEVVLPIDMALERIASVYREVIPRGLSRLRLIRVGYDLRWIPCRGVHVANLSEIAQAETCPVGEREDSEDLALGYIVAPRGSGGR